jgi:hypothetical protein
MNTNKELYKLRIYGYVKEMGFAWSHCEQQAMCESGLEATVPIQCELNLGPSLGA